MSPGASRSRRWAWGAAHPRWRLEHLRLDIRPIAMKLSLLGGPRAVCGGSRPEISGPRGIRHPGSYDGNMIHHLAVSLEGPGKHQRGLMSSTAAETPSLAGVGTRANITFSTGQLFVSGLVQKGLKEAFIWAWTVERKTTQKTDLL